MLGRTFQRLCFILAIASLSVWTVAVAQDYEVPQSRSRKDASGWATKTAKAIDVDAAIQEKLQRILANQQTILEKADAVKAELEVIKVRVSMRRTRTTSQ